MKASRICLFTTALALSAGALPGAAQDPPLDPQPPTSAPPVFRSSDAANEFEVTLQPTPLGGQTLGNDEFELVLIEADPLPDPEIFRSGFELPEPPPSPLAHAQTKDTP